MLFRRSCIPGFLFSSRAASSSIAQKIIEIYTDGSCYHNKSSSVGGYAVYFPGAEHPTVCESVSGKSVTSPRCELIAVKKALDIYSDKFHGNPCTIYTDSMYVINSLYQYSPVWHKNGWKKTDDKPVKNQDLLVPLCEIFDANRKYVSIKHVKAHSRNQGKHLVNNSVVDVLAKKWSRRCARGK